jgi:hypothetical protein
MYINPNTGKGWTDAEEATFADIMRIGHLTRIKAIHLWARCKRNTEKSLALAAEYGVTAQAAEAGNAARAEGARRSREARSEAQKDAA